jgi:hypothetical protein
MSLRPSTPQVRRLHDEVEALVKDTVAPALADVVAKAATAASLGSEKARGYGEILRGGVSVRPLVAILAAAFVGYGLGRITR